MLVNDAIYRKRVRERLPHQTLRAGSFSDNPRLVSWLSVAQVFNDTPGITFIASDFQVNQDFPANALPLMVLRIHWKRIVLELHVCRCSLPLDFNLPSTMSGSLLDPQRGHTIRYMLTNNA